MWVSHKVINKYQKELKKTPPKPQIMQVPIITQTSDDSTYTIDYSLYGEISIQVMCCNTGTDV